MDYAELLQRLQADVGELQRIAVSEDTDRTAAIPSCPGWTAADLLGHLWSIEDWVRSVLRTREPLPAPDPSADSRQAVADFIDGVPGYLTAMRAIVPDEPCWNLGPRPRLAGFWIRRQAHEHVIHRWDLANAGVGDPVAIDANLAADGVDEVFTMFYPRQVHRGLASTVDAAVEFRTSDAGASWTLGDGEPVAVVEAPAETLYLGLWKRRSMVGDPAVTISGDREPVQRVLANPLTP